MSKRELVLVVDVETCGNKVKKVYDLGYAVVERTTGIIVESDSLVIGEVFYGMAREMRSAYYAEKLPQYRAGIKVGKWNVVSIFAAQAYMREVCERYNIRKVYAYNCAFDRDALNSTMRVLTDSDTAIFFPRRVIFCDIWHMACQVIMTQVGYREFANTHGWITEVGNLRTSAEACYAFISGTPNFEEEHTGLADVMIEIEIMVTAIKKKKRMSEEIWRACWKIPQRIDLQPALF